MGRGKSKKELKAALPDQCFFVHEGPILSDLKELERALRHEMTDEQFAHHVTEGRNDFANWIEFALHDKACANLLRNTTKKGTTLKRVEQCLARYLPARDTQAGRNK